MRSNENLFNGKSIVRILPSGNKEFPPFEIDINRIKRAYLDYYGIAIYLLSQHIKIMSAKNILSQALDQGIITTFAFEPNSSLHKYLNDNRFFERTARRGKYTLKGETDESTRTLIQIRRIYTLLGQIYSKLSENFLSNKEAIINILNDTNSHIERTELYLLSLEKRYLYYIDLETYHNPDEGQWRDNTKTPLYKAMESKAKQFFKDLYDLIKQEFVIEEKFGRYIKVCLNENSKEYTDYLRSSKKRKTIIDALYKTITKDLGLVYQDTSLDQIIESRLEHLPDLDMQLKELLQAASSDIDPNIELQILFPKNEVSANIISGKEIKPYFFLSDRKTNTISLRLKFSDNITDEMIRQIGKLEILIKDDLGDHETFIYRNFNDFNENNRITFKITPFYKTIPYGIMNIKISLVLRSGFNGNLLFNYNEGEYKTVFVIGKGGKAKYGRVFENILAEIVGLSTTASFIGFLASLFQNPLILYLGYISLLPFFIYVIHKNTKKEKEYWKRIEFLEGNLHCFFEDNNLYKKSLIKKTNKGMKENLNLYYKNP